MAERSTNASGTTGQGGTASGRLQSAASGATQQAQGMADQASATGRDIKDRVGEIASSSAEGLKQQAAELTDAAKELASQAGEKLKERVNDQKDMGADYVGNLAETIRRAAREFDKDLPIAGVYMRKAAAQVESISDTVRQGDLQDLLDGAQDFARRQPSAFLGLAVLAGFGAVRFLKSSASSASGNDDDDADATSQRRGSAGNRRRRGTASRSSPALRQG